MAKQIPTLSTILFTLLFTLTSFVAIQAAEKSGHATLGLGRERMSHFTFFWHDILSGHNPTSVSIVQGTNNSKTGFGMIRMIDNALTEGPELSSKLIGRAQGFYGSASQQKVGLLMLMNFVFSQGKYNGSTITVSGKNEVFDTVREMPVVGGSGLFRFARGYVQLKTRAFDVKTLDATVEYNVYVLHY